MTSFIPTRVGYNFAGWYTEDGTQLSGSDGILDNNWTYTTNYASTGYMGEYPIYAHWTAKRVQVTLNPNGGQIAGSTGNTDIWVEFDSNRVYSSATGGTTSIPVATWTEGVYDFTGY